MAVPAVVLAGLHLSSRPPTLCTLRALTGVPCPLCGSTTAIVSLGRADVLAALRASPLAVTAVVFFVLSPLRSRLRVVLPEERLSRLSQARALALIGAVAIASELWQLQRFGLL